MRWCRRHVLLMLGGRGGVHPRRWLRCLRMGGLTRLARSGTTLVLRIVHFTGVVLVVVGTLVLFRFSGLVGTLVPYVRAFVPFGGLSSKLRGRDSRALPVRRIRFVSTVSRLR